jgi:hypothetical protein
MEKVYVKNYKEIRGTVNRKGVSILKKYYFVVSDGQNQTRVCRCYDIISSNKAKI